ncbi:ABC transporter permease subunit [Defluviimonas sp. WL0002]|uniref:ABC transporter permease subunit n=1 Tax=Albidovulum marisflavi TaxID=2984159 RepID=A0ABT2Z9C5_9RHOB|nr:ABC transporter permease subunit [Defluviimonas sp. WL0002]MCV2867733.1 ABC transporter permease subunit [Defluviimonas sp. WL0002]
MTRAGGRWLRGLVLAVVMLGLVLPIAAGLWETLAAAFGHLPAIGETGASLDPWRRLLDLPGVVTSVKLTLWTGLASTAIALLLALGAAGWAHRRFGPRALGRVLTPFLAVPHAALAIGLAFVIMPSGWIARAISPWATGWDLPPDLAIVNDPAGLALILGLVIKELPFFLLVTLAALAQIPVGSQMRAGRAIGYPPAQVWAFVIVPQVYAQIRLPVYVVLSFALSVVDMAIILGPSNPPVLAVAMTRWFLAPDSGLILPASAAAMTQALIVVGAIALWRGAEALIAVAGRAILRQGRRRHAWAGAARASAGIAATLFVLGLLSLAALTVWSIAWRWSFPDMWPETLSLHSWARPGAGWGLAVLNTAVIGFATTALALVLAVAWLEGEDRGGLARARWAEALVYLPLIVPQVAFLFGLQVVFLRLGVSGGIGAVIWAQALFVFPYVMIALSDPWRALDRRLLRAAAALGAGPARRLFAVKLPILLRPLLTAAAIGFAVSVAQYLPTLFMGAGRVPTLTTEAVTLSSGSDRRVTGTYATLQSALPFLAYAAAFFIPAWVFRHRRALSGEPG